MTPPSNLALPGTDVFRFALPRSIATISPRRVEALQDFLQNQLACDVEVTLSESYDELTKRLAAGRVDAAWAPPFVCARLEGMGTRVALRQVRHGASTYCAALVSLTDAPWTLDNLRQARAAWNERDSVGGYLLAMAFLKERQGEKAVQFKSQSFCGSYRSALEAVHAGQADITSVFADADQKSLGLVELWPEQSDAFRVLAFTDEAPNDGIAISSRSTSSQIAQFELTMLAMHQSPEGRAVLSDCFCAERFETAPRQGYRALYRVALASL